VSRLRLTSSFRFFSILSISTIFYVLKVSTWGIDPLHEGVLIGTVFGIRFGQIPFVDMLEYKGLGFPFFINLILRGEFLTIHNIRILLILIASLCCVLAYFIMKRQGVPLAVPIIIIWFLSPPTISTLYSRPWPGIFLIDSNLLVVFFTLLAINAAQLLETSRTSSAKTIAYISLGTAIAILPWIRIQSLFFSFVTLTILGLTWKTMENTPRKIYSFFLASTLIGLFSPFLYLSYNSAVREWFQQIIILPQLMRENLSGASNWAPGQLTKTLFVYTFMSILFLMVFSLYHLLSKLNVPDGATVLGFSAIFVFSSFFALTKLVDPSKSRDFNNWKILATQWWPQVFSFFSLLTSLLVLPLFLLVFVGRIFHSRRLMVSSRYSRNIEQVVDSLLPRGLSSLLIVAGTVNCLIYMFPNTGNLWTMSLLPMLFISRFLLVLPEKKRFHVVRLARNFTLSFLIMLILLWANASTIPREDYNSSFLKNLVDSSPSKIKKVDSELELLRTFPDFYTYRFLCNYGILPVSNGRNQSSSYDWTSLTIMRTLPTRPVLLEKRLFICDSSLDAIQPYLQSGFVIVGEDNSLRPQTFVLERRS
jgi:hypothetical protein